MHRTPRTVQPNRFKFNENHLCCKLEITVTHGQLHSRYQNAPSIRRVTLIDHDTEPYRRSQRPAILMGVEIKYCCSEVGSDRIVDAIMCLAWYGVQRGHAAVSQDQRREGIGCGLCPQMAGIKRTYRQFETDAPGLFCLDA